MSNCRRNRSDYYSLGTFEIKSFSFHCLCCHPYGLGEVEVGLPGNPQLILTKYEIEKESRKINCSKSIEGREPTAQTKLTALRVDTLKPECFLTDQISYSQTSSTQASMLPQMLPHLIYLHTDVLNARKLITQLTPIFLSELKETALCS